MKFCVKIRHKYNYQLHAKDCSIFHSYKICVLQRYQVVDINNLLVENMHMNTPIKFSSS
jgi:hypothetical protein